MTREEEYKQIFAKIDEKYHYDALYGACIDMAKWADETMIEKACKWLQENICYNKDKKCALIDDFKNAMKNS